MLRIDLNDNIVLYISESHKSGSQCQCSICKNEIQMQDLDKHIHESDGKLNDNKQEVADETIDRVGFSLPNFDQNGIQMQDLDKHIHESDAKSIND